MDLNTSNMSPHEWDELHLHNFHLFWYDSLQVKQLSDY